MPRRAPVIQAGRGSLARLPAHTNPGLEIVVLLRGQVEWEVEGRRVVVRPGSVFFTLPWQRHGSVAEYEPGHEWAFVVLAAGGDVRRGLRLDVSLGFTVAEAREIAAALGTERRHTWTATPALRHAVTELAAEVVPATSAQTLGGARQVSLARLAVVELMRSRVVAAKTGAERRVERLRAELEAEFDRPWTLAEMAGRCGLGRTRFAALFTRETGDSPLVYLNRLRVAQARAWLRGTSRPVTQIAHDCGFSSSQYFARVFRAFTGRDARGYRAENEGRR